MASGTRLFVGNLPEDINESDLQRAFSTFGEVVNLDVKTNKNDNETNKKNFAFVTLTASNHEVETCIKHFSSRDFHGKSLYVTRARESFLERLQRERQQEQDKQAAKSVNTSPKKQPTLNLSEKLNPRKRKLSSSDKPPKVKQMLKQHDQHQAPGDGLQKTGKITENDKKKQDSDQKRMESMRKKRQEFNEKKTIIKTGLIGIDKATNKKIIFSDDEGITKQKQPMKQKSAISNPTENKATHNKTTFLFEDDDGSDPEVNFNIKEHKEGKKGKKVLDLQSSYKSDKRFMLDERFVGDECEDDPDNEQVELRQEDEKTKQLNILQHVLGVPIKTRSTSTDASNNKKIKPKMGMLRFDPTQPEHAKFLAPVDQKQEPSKKSKKNKNKDQQNPETEVIQQPEPPKVEVSKETFYKVSDTLKETIAQPTTFSLRSLFGEKGEDNKNDEPTEQDIGYIPLQTAKPAKVKNPLDPGERNPFMYDSSDSEEETGEPSEVAQPESLQIKAVWKENLFFTHSDCRLKEGLEFFNKPIGNEGQKERRELKSLMKKRIYNKERKNQMFQKKIGGRKKTMKKSYNKNKSDKR